MAVCVVGDYHYQDKPVAEDIAGTLYTGTNTTGESAVYIKRLRRETMIETANGLVLPLEHIVDPRLVSYQAEVVQGRVRYAVVAQPQGELLSACLPSLRADGLWGRYQLLSAMTDVCQAVGTLHRNGLVHGGINPTMIVIRQGEQPKACLFRFEPFLARPTGHYLQGDHALVFVAQEQLRGKGGLASDIYALGMLLYVSFGAEPPFDGAPPYELGEQIIAGNVAPFRPCLDGLDAAVAEAIMADLETIGMVADKALQRDPAARYTTVTQMHRLLKQITERLSPLNLGYRFYREGRHKLAASVLEEASNKPSDFLGGSLLLGRIYGIELGDYLAAITTFKRILKKHPDLGSARRNLAEVYALHGRFGLAKRELSDMLMHSPDDPDLMMSYAMILQQNGQPQEALNVVRRVQNVSPYHLRAYLTAIQISDAKSNYKEAEEDCRRALDRIAEVIDKGNLDSREVSEVYYWRGLLHRRLGRPESAMRWLQKALKLNPTHSQSHLILAELYAEAGQNAQSLQHLMSGLRVDPNQKGIIDLVGRMFSGQAPSH